MRRFLSLRWIGLHLLAVAMIVAFVPLGRWQWLRGSDPDGGLRNYGYGIEWWLFACFVVFMWVRLVHDELKPPAERRAAQRGEAAAVPAGAGAEPVVVEPQEDDPELDAYNAYLASLHAVDLARDVDEARPRAKARR